MTLSEKTFAFNINGALIIEKDDGSGKISTSKESWSLTTKDNIRWFLMIGSQEHEIIVSYEKNGSQYVKLTHQASGKNTSVYYEAILHSLK